MWLLLETPRARLGKSIGTAKRLTVSDSSSPTGGLYFISLIFPLGFSKEPAGPLKKLVEPFWRKFQIFDFLIGTVSIGFEVIRRFFLLLLLSTRFFAKSRLTFFCCCLHKSQFYFIFITPTKTSLSFDVITVDGLIHKRRLEWRRILFSVTFVNFRLTLQSNRKLIE